MHIFRSLDIEAPPGRVWEYLTEPELQKFWINGLVGHSLIAGVPHEVGSVVQIALRQGEKLVTYESTLLEVDRPRHLLIKLMGGLFREDTPLLVRYDLEDMVSNTRLNYICSFELRGFMRLAAWIFKGMAKISARRDLERLKLCCEAPDSP